MPDVNSEEWPHAVHPNLILTDKGDTEKQFRALQVAGIINAAGVEFKDKRVLDLGCGEGHVVTEIARQAEFTLGFDIIHDNSWDKKRETAVVQNLKCEYSSDPLFVEGQDNFDVIVLFDVLDHAIKLEPGDLLAWCAGMLAPDGIIFVRFHPWTSRSGGHLYDQLNKAFVQLVLTPDELAKMGVAVTEAGAKANQRIVRPLATYNSWIEKAGLAVKERKPKAVEVEPFFQSLLPRINEVSWAGKCDVETITKIMQTDTIDFILTRNESNDS